MKRVPRSKDSATTDTIVPVETHEPGKAPLPRSEDFGGMQLALFQTLLANTDDQRDKLSNAIDLWDSVPRYSVTRQQMFKARIDDRFLEEQSIDFQHRGKQYTCVIFPARVADFDGVRREYYPSASEELVEDALRKLATDADRGYYNGTENRGGVTFTLYALSEELAARNHARSYQEIVQSLNILSQSVIELRPHDEGEQVIKSTYLPMLAAVSRKKYLADPESKWAVQFHPLVAAAIQSLDHKQFNYDKLMKHRTQLARWIHRQLVLKFGNADSGRQFEMRYSTIRRDSAMLNGYNRERDAIEAVREAYKELLDDKVIAKLEIEAVRGPRKRLLDEVYTMRASEEFIYNAKAANKRNQMVQERATGRPTPKPPLFRR